MMTVEAAIEIITNNADCSRDVLIEAAQVLRRVAASAISHGMLREIEPRDHLLLATVDAISLILQLVYQNAGHSDKFDRVTEELRDARKLFNDSLDMS